MWSQVVDTIVNLLIFVKSIFFLRLQLLISLRGINCHTFIYPDKFLSYGTTYNYSIYVDIYKLLSLFFFINWNLRYLNWAFLHRENEFKTIEYFCFVISYAQIGFSIPSEEVEYDYYSPEYTVFCSSCHVTL